ncbi:MAG TPA: RodZ domain-containing protein [Steroidobacteraceae bacterium]|nr:RodZ domain-containing protein [Steroidobacteraceae bacterium]
MGSDPVGIGARLRAGREKLGLTVLQAAERLHVDPRILEAIESEDFLSLGAPVYARGHLRHYAELVGEPVAQLMEAFSRVPLEAPPDLTRIAKAPPSSESNKLIVPALFVLAVFAVAGAVGWVLSLSPPQPIPTNETPAPAQNADRQAPGPAAPGSGGVSTPPRPGVAQPRAGASPTHFASAEGAGSITVPVSPSPAGTPVQAAGGTASTASPPAAAAGAAAAAAGAPATESAPHPSRDQQVTLRYSADCWTEVYDSSGQRLFYDVGAAGSTRTLKGTAPLRIVLANAAGVAVEVDGHGTSIARMAQPDGSAEFLVNRSGRIARARTSSSGD